MSDTSVNVVRLTLFLMDAVQIRNGTDRFEDLDFDLMFVCGLVGCNDVIQRIY